MPTTTTPANLALIAGSRRKPESTWVPRISRAQEEIILEVTRNMKATESMIAYVNTGDLSHLTADENKNLTKAVAQCKNRVATPSQARRFWPRKLAAVIVNR